MTKSNQKKLAKLIVALILGVIGLYFQVLQPKTPTNDQPAKPGYYDVLSIADGDTITVNMEGKKERIRYIGVDTPEVYHGGSTPPSECYADKAKAYNTASIGGKRVKLVSDPEGSNRDKYGRLLRYVYSSDDKNINESLVAEGYGFEMDAFAFSKKQEFRDAMNSAESNKKGLWLSARLIGLRAILRLRANPA